MFLNLIKRIEKYALIVAVGVICMGGTGRASRLVWAEGELPEFNAVGGAISAHVLSLGEKRYWDGGGAGVVAVRQSVARYDYDEVFGRYGEQYGLDKAYLKRVAFCESSYNPKAVNGVYGGMYQFLASTWSATRREMGLDPDPDLRFEAEEAIKTAAYKISKEGAWAWPVCGRGGS
jgi:soluble lytic murein transglycosylase-like protein